MNSIIYGLVSSWRLGRSLGIAPKEIDVTVYVPISFPQRLKDGVRLSEARLEEVDEGRELFEGVLTTGELDGGIEEQSLVLRTPRGLVVITGCDHPGIVHIVEKAKEIGEDRVYLVLKSRRTICWGG